MAVTLVLRSQGDEPCVTFDQPRIAIGRSEGCDFRIPEPSVSHRHASIRQRGTDLVVMDEGSTNGTFLGTTRLHPHTPITLRHGSMLRFGRIWVEVRFEAALPTAQPMQATKDLALAMVAHALGDEGQGLTPKVVVVEGPDAGREVSLAEAGRSVIIGRGRDVDFPIDVTDASRRHARVVRRGDVALLRDLGSRNGTQVGEEHVSVDRDTTLRAGDEFRIGPDVFVFENPAVEVLRQIEAAEDEALGSDAEIESPPKSSVEPTPPPAPAEEPLLEDGAPVPAPVHPRNVRRPLAKKGPGWGKADVIIVLLALGVLAISAIGLFWLFRG
jgi:pSer/pThr/pTyr-binding forkhead associated (FHA) protein